jgi:diguanylate cyclase (GGDEF)-like protein/PAS domain S-box-containing protein
MAPARTLAVVAPLAGLAGLLAGLTGVLPAAPAIGLGVSVTAAGYVFLLSRWPFRPTGFLSAGILIAAMSTVAAIVAREVAPAARVSDVPLPVEIPLIGLFFTVGMYLIGLLLMPGAAPTVVGRIRRCLDAVGIGVCGFFIVWLVLFDTAGLRGGALTAVLLASVAFAAMAVAGLRAMGRRPLTALCAAGPAVSILGQTALIVALDYFADAGWLLAAGALLIAGPVLTWYGHVAADARNPEPPADQDAGYVAHPVLVLPLAGALVAAGYHVVRAHSFDTVALVLAIVGVAIVATREALSVVDIRRYAVHLAEQEAHFRSLVAGSADVTIVLDPDLRVRWQSPAAAREFSLSDQEVVGQPLVTLVHPEDVSRVAGSLSTGGGLVEARLRDGYGVWRDTEWSLSDQRGSPEVDAVVVHIRDVTVRREVARTAQSDQLTGLPSRRELGEALVERGLAGALMVVAVEGVDGVNEARGHDVGDAVLAEAARRLRAGTAPTDLLTRLAGGRFAVATEGGAVQAQLLATRLVTMLTEPYPIAGTVAHVTASVGLAELAAGDADVDELVRRAELALRRAGRRGLEWYDTALEAVLSRRLEIEQALPGVVARGELGLLYQPVVDLVTGRTVGAEALLRWHHPVLGQVGPDEFVPVAEELGVLDEIEEWVVHRACRQLSAWTDDERDLWVSINVTGRQLASPAFVGAVTVAVNAHQIPRRS